MKQITSVQDVGQLGTIVSLWAHPDDESFLAAGIMAAAIQNGQKVVCVTATKGEAGVQDESRWPAARLGEIRAHELKAGLAVLGVSDHHWLDYPDGECQNVATSQAVRRIADIIEQYEPQTIVTFGPEGLTGHPDHRTVSRWASEAVKASAKKSRIYHAVYTSQQYERYLKPLDARVNLFYRIDKPPLVEANNCAIAFALPKEILEQKWRALAAMPSQMERLLRLIPSENRQGTFGCEYFVRA